MPQTLDEHYGYLTDQTKVARFEAAIGQAVGRGDLVLDLGCGSGLLGLLALRAGAAKVLFVEEGPIIEVARRAVDEAGFTDRAEFFQANSYDLALSERVDVIVCDHVGYFGFDYDILPLLADAKQRFLKAGGTILPAEIDVYLALIESKTSRELVGRWREESVPAEFRWVSAPQANAKHGVEAEAGHLVSSASAVTTLVLGEDVDEFLSWQAGFTVDRDATLDGILGWFDCRLHGDIRITNAPTADDALERPQAFLPLENAITVKQGERIDVTVMARPLDHVIAWVVEVQGQRHALTTFNGLLIDNEALDRGRTDRLAHLNSRGLARQIVLSYCDGTRTVAEVEALILTAHPDLFPSRQATQAFVRSVLASDTGA